MCSGLLASALLGCALAHEPAEPTIKVDVGLVNLVFIVRDKAGGLNRGLAKADVEVFEDGVRREIRFFGKSGDLPLRLALAGHMSGSQQKFIKQHHHDIERFLKSALTPKDQAMLACFGNHAGCQRLQSLRRHADGRP
jgi:hypothetical protein